MKIQSIAKNTSYFTFALILQKIISFTYFTILARNLFPEDLGKFYLALGFTSMFAIFMDKGMANLLVREVAKAKDKANQLLGSILAIKLVLTIITLVSLFAAANLLGYSELVRQLIYIAAIAMVLDSFTTTFWAVIRGFHVLKFEAIGSIIFQLIVLGLGVYFIKAGFDLRWVLMAQVTASLFNFLYSLFLLIIKFKIKITLVYKITRLKPIILLVIPFALFGIFQRLYIYLDTVLLSKLANEYYVGLYQIPFKIVFALQFLPMAFIASLYPAFASYWKENKLESPPSRGDPGGCITTGCAKPPPQIVVTFERAMGYLLIISLPISIGVITLADKILLIFKTEYSGAELPLMIIMAALVFIFINFPIGALLNACDKQKVNTMNMGIVLVASVILNIILIPKYQVIGASITVLVTNILMFILGLYWVPKIITYRPRKILDIFLRALFAAAAMGIFTWYLKASLNIVVIIILAGIIYFSVLILLGGIKKEDIKSISKSFLK